MPAPCKPFSQTTLRWDRFEQFLAGGTELGDGDRRARLQAASHYSKGDLRAFGVLPAEMRRLRRNRSIRQGAMAGLTGRPQARELFDRLLRYVRRAYQRDQQAGSPSPGHVAEFLIL